MKLSDAIKAIEAASVVMIVPARGLPVCIDKHTARNYVTDCVNFMAEVPSCATRIRITDGRVALGDATASEEVIP